MFSEKIKFIYCKSGAMFLKIHNFCSTNIVMFKNIFNEKKTKDVNAQVNDILSDLELQNPIIELLFES
jgi:hypothetical protein